MIRKKLKPIDIQKIKEAYNTKYEEFDKFTLEELKTLFNESSKNKKTRIGGIYKKALLDVVSKKLQEQSLKEAVDEIKKENNNIKTE